MRTDEKGRATILRLQKHVDRDPGIKALSHHRLSFLTQALELTSLRSVQMAAKRLLTAVPKIDAMILNAGIAGPVTINWPKAVWRALIDPVYEVTYPSFSTGSIGLLTRPQLDPLSAGNKSFSEEPPLGQIFTANIFGHYLLAHALTPLLSRASPDAGRIIGVSSLEALGSYFSLSDLQGLAIEKVYGSSKRLTDILFLTAAMPATKPYVESFFTTPKDSKPLHPQPRFYVCQPGICKTGIFPLPLVMVWVQTLALYIARWLGSPWHPISTYKGAVSPVWLALAAQETLDGIEKQGGVGKWGSSTDALGRERVRRTEVDGWGYGGRILEERHYGSRGRRRGVKDVTKEDKEEFEELGRVCWKAMEQLRVEWEGRLR